MEDNREGTATAEVEFFSMRMSHDLRQRIRVQSALAGVSSGEYVRDLLERRVPKVPDFAFQSTDPDPED